MISTELLSSILINSEEEAWNVIAKNLYETWSLPYTQPSIQEIIKREKAISDLETLLSGACWDIWNSFERYIPKTSRLLLEFWNSVHSGKAIFLIDGLSLREMPILLEEAQKRGYVIQHSSVSGSELPSETTYFARSLGFAQRSALENSTTSSNHPLKGGKTDCVDLPWNDCLPLINSEPNWILWHTWFDDQIHALNEPGKGLRDLTMKSEEHFRSDEFWGLVWKLSQGRKLVITSDHGYATTGDFMNVTDDQADYYKKLYKSQRFTKSEAIDINWMPPIDIPLESTHGSFRYVLGKRKWKSSGGYPTLAHGGVSMMETFVPFIHLTR